MTDDTKRIAGIIAGEINAKPEQAAAAIELLDGGATVPFVARYRKEATGGLDDTQLRLLAERLSYLRELEARREAILNSIREQNKLTDELEAKIAAAATKAELEDIYLPYKPKRRTKAEIARELGLGPLADSILADRAAVPLELAQAYVGEKVPDTKAALDGARDILTEQFAENADLIGKLRIYIKGRAFLRARVADGKQEAGAKFSDYFDHIEKWATVPSHRALAMLRGRNEEILYLDIEVDADLAAPAVKPVEQMIADAYTIGRKLPGDQWLMGVVGWTWRVKLSLHFSIELMTDLRERADKDAIDVFARNLKDLLLAPPAGSRATMGLDPGIRTGVKVAVTDATGKVLATTTVYPFPPKNDVRGTQAELATLIRKHGVELIAIGNGTGSRETEKLVAEMLSDLPAPKPLKVIVSEAGASVYSASETAAREFPTLDVSLRGAVSIARRLQDPLAELVKIEPKSIGVGQYQHDVDQYRLSRSLEGVVEDAVNAVGVDLNTASAPLLARVSGLGASLADAIVAHRDETGPFANRKELLKVSRLGQRTFEQCAGFLRISNGSEPLDASAVHPEAYAVAKQIIAACGRDVRSIMGDSATLKALDPRVFVNERFGLPTVRDIIAELEKPGRDPRPAFKTATFADGIDSMKDLVPGMLLEGTVTNVAAFGAFVDIGVHQDGLVHVSQLADRFVKEAHEVVKAGDVVKVRVIAVDLARKRISLSMRKEIEGGVAGASARETSQPERKAPRRAPVKRATPPEPATQGALGAALAAALKRKSGARQLRRVVKPRVSSFGCGWLRQRCDRRCSTSTRYGNRKTMPDIFFIIGARMKRFLALLSFAVAMAYGSATSLAAPFVFSNFAHPESEFGTYANDINNNGVVIGYYLNNSGTFGFVKTGNTFATVTHPLASGETTISGINDAGAWVGDYTAAGRIHGYLNVGGTFTSIDNPLAHTRTTVSGINNAGAIVGQYDTADGIVHGFLSQGGAFVTIDIPNTISGTFVTGINDNGAVSGYFNDAAGYHSFVYEGGVFTSIDNPDADVSQGTFATGINNNGHITGLYFNSSGTHGFIDIGGVFTALDDPLANLGTVANGLNDLDQITGYYIGSIRGGLPDAAFVTAFPSADVPLPPTSLLLATGVLALLGVRRGGLGRS